MIDFEKKLPYTWGTDGLDKAFGNYDGGLLNIILGESGHGKTEYMFFQAEMNYNIGNELMFFSLEMTRKDLILRKCRARACVSKEQWSKKTMSDNQKKIMREEYDRLMDLPFIANFDSEEYTLPTIKQSIMDCYKDGIKLFYIDNLGFITSEIKGESELDFTARISRELKQMCNEIGITINLLHHFNKGNDKDRGKPRSLGSIRGSGKIENDADLIISVYRDTDPDSDEKNISQIMLLKDRLFGQPANHKLKFEKGNYIDYDEVPFVEPKRTKKEQQDEYF